MKDKLVFTTLLLSSGYLILGSVAQDTPQYEYQVQLSRTEVNNNNDAIVQTTGSDGADDTNVNWLQTIDQDTTLYFWWSIDKNDQTVRELVDDDAVNFCDGLTMDPGSMTYHALKIFTAYFADGSDCPIQEGTFDIPSSLDYTFKMSDKMPCGNQDLTMNIGREKYWAKTDLSLTVSYAIPEDNNCE